MNVPALIRTFLAVLVGGLFLWAGFHAWWIDNQGNRRYIGWFDPGCYRA